MGDWKRLAISKQAGLFLSSFRRQYAIETAPKNTFLCAWFDVLLLTHALFYSHTNKQTTKTLLDCNIGTNKRDDFHYCATWRNNMCAFVCNHVYPVCFCSYRANFDFLENVSSARRDNLLPISSKGRWWKRRRRKKQPTWALKERDRERKAHIVRSILWGRRR